MGHLRCLCSPGVDEDTQSSTTANIDQAWPDHFDNAIQQLNKCIIPALCFSPKELLLGLIVNTPHTPLTVASSKITPSNIEVQLTYVSQQRLDAADRATLHATCRKAVFNKLVQCSQEGEVLFKKGYLVQVYDSVGEHTMSTSRKLLPQWSAPRCVVACIVNSYKLETLEGFPLPGLFHARQLHHFLPGSGLMLADMEDPQVEEQGTDGSETSGLDGPEDE